MSDQSDQQEERDDAELESETIEDLERGASATDVVGGMRRTPTGEPDARRTPDGGPDIRAR